MGTLGKSASADSLRIVCQFRGILSRQPPTAAARKKTFLTWKKVVGAPLPHSPHPNPLLTSLSEFHNKHQCCQCLADGVGRVRVKIPPGVPSRLHHPDGCILFLGDDDSGCTTSGRQLLSSLPPLFVLIPQVTEKLLEVENETVMKVADLEKLLLQKDKDLQLIRVSVEGGPL